jgi:tetratricopeptide (TPR) repeat protein
VIAGWPALSGFMKAHYQCFPGRASTELALWPQAERELRTGLQWLSPGYLVGSYSDLLCDELSQFYLGKVLEQEGKKEEALKFYRAFLGHFEHSTARLLQIREARDAVQRLESESAENLVPNHPTSGLRKGEIAGASTGKQSVHFARQSPDRP